MTHIPVLYQEVLTALRPRPHARFIDGTAGGGGHSEGLLAAADDVHVLAFDRDPVAIQAVRERLAAYGDRLTLVNQNFAAMGELAPGSGFGAVDGVLLDLGLSSRFSKICSGNWNGFSTAWQRISPSGNSI